MKYTYKSEQSGRSMVEMLGVLAIVGVLSVGGIAGYSKAMAKFKQSKVMDQVSMVVANVRTMFSGQPDFTGLNTNIAISSRIIPEDMIVSSSSALNAFNGAVDVAVDGTQTREFTVTFMGLPRDACVALATSDWGQGLQGLAVNSGTTVPTTEQATIDGTTRDNSLPMSIVTATGTGACVGDGETNNVRWRYN